MKKKRKQILATFLVVTMLMNCFTTVTYASELPKENIGTEQGNDDIVIKEVTSSDLIGYQTLVE